MIAGVVAILDRAGAWVGARLQVFGVKRALVALFAGLMLVGLAAALVVAGGVATALWKLWN